MPKQVKAATEQGALEVPVNISSSAEQSPGNTPHNLPSTKTLYVKVSNFEKGTGKTLGERIVDMYHIGTRNFMAKNLWWATQHGHDTEIVMVSEEEVGSYMAKRELDLIEKFGAPKTNKPAAVAA